MEKIIGLNQFLDDYPLMSRVVCLGSGIRLRGEFNFKAVGDDCEEVEDTYMLEIVIPDQFPRDIPTVKEIGGKIPREDSFHVNGDGSLCLGSPIRLMKKIYDAPNLTGFINGCLVPYLYAVSSKLKNGGGFLFGQLSHGNQGISEDYSDIFGLQNNKQTMQAIQLLCNRKRIANKKRCPCGCGKKLGACQLHNKLNMYRKMAPTSWFSKSHYIANKREKKIQHRQKIDSGARQGNIGQQKP